MNKNQFGLLWLINSQFLVHLQYKVHKQQLLTETVLQLQQIHAVSIDSLSLQQRERQT